MKNVTPMNIWDSPLFLKIQKMNVKERAHIQSGCPFDEDFFKDIEIEVMNKVPYDINGSKKYIIHCGNKGNQKWNKLYHDGCDLKLTTSMKKIYKRIRCIGHCTGSRRCPNSQYTKLTYWRSFLICTTFLSQ